MASVTPLRCHWTAFGEPITCSRGLLYRYALMPERDLVRVDASIKLTGIAVTGEDGDGDYRRSLAIANSG